MRPEGKSKILEGSGLILSAPVLPYPLYSGGRCRKGGFSMKCVISAGPTRERIDAVRFLSNRSSGKMGYALAEAARDAGHEVVLVSGPTALAAPTGVTLVPVESAADMAEAMFERAADAGLVIMAAAVADYRPVRTLPGKMKKTPGNLTIELEHTVDILAELGRRKPAGQILIGFAAETDDLLANAAGKLKRKNLDWIAANDVSRNDIGFGSDNNAVTLLGRHGERVDFAPDSKYEIARRILEEVTAGR